ncbi:MAG: glycosyltransferase family 4 protein [Saprospiraceae bacterium]|nr:glycosyltransferase family 4 protein [Saprospiraceae bacterium]
MKILLLTQYFPPETGAPQNRLYDLALKLQEFGASVSVLTAFPNYPQYRIPEAYSGKIYSRENMEGLEVHRSWIYASPQKSVIRRLLNYFSFTFSSFLAGCFKAGKADLIICESPPLFLGFTAVLLKYIKGARLVFNVSDLWPESAVKLGIVTNPWLIRLSTWLEHWIYRHSDHISGQTQGIVSDIQRRFPDKPVFWLPNGVDSEEIETRITGKDWRGSNGFHTDDILVYFGGLLGYAQGLDTLVKAAKEVTDLHRVKIIIMGEGPEKERLQALKTALQADNLYFFPGVSKQEIIDVIWNMDIGIIPLKKLDLFKGAIPSKIFEILYLKKPVLLGIEGEAKDLFIEEAGAGVAFEPENHLELAQGIRHYATHPDEIKTHGQRGHDFVVQRFDRRHIAAAFWDWFQ